MKGGVRRAAKVGSLHSIRHFFFPVTALENILREQIAAAPGGMLPDSITL